MYNETYVKNTKRRGTMLDISYYEKTDEIIAQYTCEEKSLIPIIQGIQEEYRYLPPELLTYVAEKLGISEAKAYSVASFYENFSFEAKGKYVIKVCDGTACHTSNWGMEKRNTQQMTSCLQWRRFHAWAHADWHRP